MRNTTPPRGWVVRLGAYLRIFGNPYKVGSWWSYSPESAIEDHEKRAMEREMEFGSAEEPKP